MFGRVLLPTGASRSRVQEHLMISSNVSAPEKLGCACRPQLWHGVPRPAPQHPRRSPAARCPPRAQAAAFRTTASAAAAGRACRGRERVGTSVDDESAAAHERPLPGARKGAAHRWRPALHYREMHATLRGPCGTTTRPRRCCGAADDGQRRRRRETAETASDVLLLAESRPLARGTNLWALRTNARGKSQQRPAARGGAPMERRSHRVAVMSLRARRRTTAGVSLAHV